MSMPPQEVLNYVRAEPFRPFRIRMTSGRTFEIRHPEMVRVGADSLILFTWVSNNPDIYDRWETVSLSLVESLTPLEAKAS